jgi:hypothetical protein
MTVSTLDSQDMIEMLSRVYKVEEWSCSCLSRVDLGVKWSDRLVYVPLIQSG